MNVMLMNIFVAAEDGHAVDPAHSLSPYWAADAELIWGTAASIIILGALFKFAGPMVKKAMIARTAGIQTELDSSADAKTAALAEASDIRQAAGDIDAERQRLIAEADAQAETLLSEGRARLEVEITELNARADADIIAAGGRVSDEMRGEIARLSHAATERTLASGIIDEATQQQLIEAFIQNVGQNVSQKMGATS
ncbi:MAG TPA: ATP synthase F0 subunit B [Ilumatobacter sp.]|nr:ATP synthase F0 subunit B [Ilumatobacter sp.]